MKPFIIIAALLICSSSLICAQSNPSNPSKDQLNSQIKKKKTANKLLLAGGSSILLGTLLVSAPSDNAMKSTGTLLGGIALVTAGTLTSFISIPFYIYADYDKKKIGQLQPALSYSKGPHYRYTQVGVKLTF